MLWLKCCQLSNGARIPAVRRKLWLKKIVCFLTASVLIGWFYGWSSPRAFPKNTTFGFGYGMLHGALMPLALPSLVMGGTCKFTRRKIPGASTKSATSAASMSAAWSSSARCSGGPGAIDQSEKPAAVNLDDIQLAAGPVGICRQQKRLRRPGQMSAAPARAGLFGS